MNKVRDVINRKTSMSTTLYAVKSQAEILVVDQAWSKLIVPGVSRTIIRTLNDDLRRTFRADPW